MTKTLATNLEIKNFVVNKDVEYIDIQTYISDGSGPEYVANISKNLENGHVEIVWNYALNSEDAFDEIPKSVVPTHIAKALVGNAEIVDEMFTNAARADIYVKDY
jgi:hypothetical protein